MMDFSEKEEHDDILPDTNVDRERTLTGKWALAIMVAAVIFTTVAFVTPNWVEGDPRYKLMAQNYGFVKYELLLLYFSFLCAFRNFSTEVHLIEAVRKTIFLFDGTNKNEFVLQVLRDKDGEGRPMGPLLPVAARLQRSSTSEILCRMQVDLQSFH
jgi:hypothetical protein